MPVQLCRPDFQNEGNTHHGFKGDDAFAAFDAADILAIKVAQLSQPLLREAAALPQLLELFAEQNQGAGHAVRVLRKASKCKAPGWSTTRLVLYNASNVAPTISKTWYVACFTQQDGVYSCGHNHRSVRDAMNCLVPDGRSFIRAYDSGAYRSLHQREFIDFLEALPTMPWSCRNKAQGGALAASLTVSAK